MNRNTQGRGIGIYNATQNQSIRQINQFAAQNAQTNTQPQVVRQAHQVPPQYTYFIDSDNQSTPRLPPYHDQMSRARPQVSAMAMQPNANQHQGSLQDLAIVLSRLVQNQNRILQWINQQNSQQ
eukprot:255631_1